MKFRNLVSNEVVNVTNLKNLQGRIFFTVRNKGCGERFFKRNTCLVLDEHVEGGTFLKVAEGWELLDEGKKPRAPRTPRTPKQPKQPKQDAPKDEKPKEQPKDEQPSPAPVPDAEPMPEEQPAPADVDEDAVNAVAKILLSLRGSTPVNADMVRKIVREEMSKEQPKEKRVIHEIKVAELPKYELPDGQTPSDKFDTILSMVVNDRVIGRFPWLFGPAGSGKSTLAKMVADALGIPFYSVSSLQQKYELEGYTDAVGEFVQTSFYKAMAEGGVFCFDEISTTSGEVQVAFNTAAAQLVYNFPKMGMVEAHKDFHIIACDNSTGRGGDKRYISRFKLDESTLDRYNFVEVGYTESHDLYMANGDEELVTFIKAVREAIEASQTTYLATPRASKAIKALQATGMTDEDALWYGLCSGWAKQDIITIQQRTKCVNKYGRCFAEIAGRLMKR